MSVIHCAKNHFISSVLDPGHTRSLSYNARDSELSILMLTSTQYVILKTSVILPCKPFSKLTKPTLVILLAYI